MPVTRYESFNADCWKCGVSLARAENRDHMFACMELMVLAMARAGWGFHAGMISCAKCLTREGGMKMQLLHCRGEGVKGAWPGGAGDQASVQSEGHPGPTGLGDGQRLIGHEGAGQNEMLPIG